MLQGIAMQGRTHRTHGTQKVRRLYQDATWVDHTQDLFLLMNNKWLLRNNMNYYKSNDWYRETTTGDN